MAIKHFIIALTAVIVIATIHGLMFGLSWLSVSILGSMPLGNLAVAFSLSLIALVNWLYLAQAKFNKAIGLFVLVMALLWYPVGIIWSGNLRLNFTSDGELWLPFSYTVAVVCLLTFMLNIIWHVGCYVVSKWRNKVS